MGKQPFISHAVNGYSRYDLPESKAFTCTPGILYPVRIDFINPRDRVSIEQGVDVRSNPLAVPTFNPYVIRLHRFWVPMQLYHSEMRINASKFDMNDVSTNWIPASTSSPAFDSSFSFGNSLLSWLRIGNRDISKGLRYTGTDLPANAVSSAWTNADSYLAYWDIVRNYYSYSQWGLYSFAWPAAWYALLSRTTSTSAPAITMEYPKDSQYFTQRYGELSFLDAFYESQFYPGAVSSGNNTFCRRNLFLSILGSDTQANFANTDGYPVPSIPSEILTTTDAPSDQLSNAPTAGEITSDWDLFLYAHPMAVIPSSPDRFSRLLPFSDNSAVSLSGVDTIPQLAIASRLQEYKDLLGAGGNRFSDWLETFFASKIEHVDRPKLLFAASQTVNAQIIFNQTGPNGSGSVLGDQGGTVAFNDRLGRRQSYYFREPGYLIDMFSIRPVYYWSSIRPDYLNYRGADYFNPIYNDIGYQDVPSSRFYTSRTDLSFFQEPCFNEFRASYDEVLGNLIRTAPSSGLYSYWVQQRSYTLGWPSTPDALQVASLLFTDLSTVNSPFISNAEDNFIVNLSYAVKKKNLINKTFATRLSNR